LISDPTDPGEEVRKIVKKFKKAGKQHIMVYFVPMLNPKSTLLHLSAG